MKAKHLDWATCADWVRDHQGAGQRVVFTNGCFDLLHAGHVHLFIQARALGDRLVVGLNSDDSVARLKGPARPLMPLRHRLMLLGTLEPVDALVVFPADDQPAAAGDSSLLDSPYELLRELRPDVLVKGADYRPDGVVGGEFAGEVRTVPLLEGLSTSSLVERLRRSADPASAIRD
ncbi:MAG: adenylyltransferase/cytidyltransferase family protein [Candidatus Neomarinimicrobiota bacterium]